MQTSLRGILIAAVLCSLAPRVHAQGGIFDRAMLHDVILTLDPDQWQALKDNYLLDTYYSADATIDGESIPQIGIRSRGQGSRSPIKPALTLAFDKNVKGQRYHGLKSLAVKNLVQDTSMIRESLALPVFEAMGIAAPKVSFGRLTVNGEYYGVYNIIEYVEEPFLQDRFGQTSGNLFKYEYQEPYDFGWRGDSADYYVPNPFKPENHKDNPDTRALLAFIEVINQAPDEDFIQEISAYIDPRQFLTYLAVENAIAESDGILGSEGINNFYLYQLTGGGLFVFIPWDKNSSFQSPTWPLYNNFDANVLARRLIADESLRGFYVDQVEAAVTRFVKPAWLDPRLDQAYALIHDAALADPKKPYANDEFELAVSGLRGVIASRQDDVLGQASAAPGVTLAQAISQVRRQTGHQR